MEYIIGIIKINFRILDDHFVKPYLILKSLHTLSLKRIAILAISRAWLFPFRIGRPDTTI